MACDLCRPGLWLFGVQVVQFGCARTWQVLGSAAPWAVLVVADGGRGFGDGQSWDGYIHEQVIGVAVLRIVVDYAVADTAH